MRISSLGLVLGAMVCLLATSSASAAVIFTTGIATETHSGAVFDVTFTDWGGGNNTVIGSGGRKIRNLQTGPFTADITFSFTGVTFHSSDHVMLYINNTSEQYTAQVLSVGGTSVTGTSVNMNTTATTISYNLPFTMSGGMSGVTTVTIRFGLPITASASIDIDALATPEPGTFALLGMGLLGASAWAHRRRKRKKKD